MIRISYEMTATAEDSDAMEQALVKLAEVISALPGSAGASVMRDDERAGQFLFLEHWPSAEVHAESAKAMPKDAFDGIKPLLAAPPVRRFWSVLV